MAPLIENLAEWAHHLLVTLDRQVAATRDPELRRCSTKSPPIPTSPRSTRRGGSARTCPRWSLRCAPRRRRCAVVVLDEHVDRHARRHHPRRTAHRAVPSRRRRHRRRGRPLSPSVVADTGSNTCCPRGQSVGDHRSSVRQDNLTDSHSRERRRALPLAERRGVCVGMGEVRPARLVADVGEPIWEPPPSDWAAQRERTARTMPFQCRARTDRHRNRECRPECAHRTPPGSRSAGAPERHGRVRRVGPAALVWTESRDTFGALRMPPPSGHRRARSDEDDRGCSRCTGDVGHCAAPPLTVTVVSPPCGMFTDRVATCVVVPPTSRGQGRARDEFCRIGDRAMTSPPFHRC